MQKAGQKVNEDPVKSKGWERKEIVLSLNTVLSLEKHCERLQRFHEP